MRFLLSLILFSIAITAWPARDDELMRTAREVRLATYGFSKETRDFDLTATVSFTRREDDHILFAIEDATGHADINLYGETIPLPEPGMRLRITGRFNRQVPFREAVVETLSCLARESTPTPKDVTGPDLLSGKADCQLTRITGVVRDVSVSELNANWAFLVVNCQGQKVYISVPARDRPTSELNALVDTKISAVGICLPFDRTFRAHMGRVFKVSSADSIHPITNSAPCQDDLPNIESIGYLSPSDIALLGRHRVTGRVIAVWGDNQTLLRTSEGYLAGVEFASGSLPTYGDLIDACGLPETDLYQINLTHAIWRKRTCEPLPPAPPQDVVASRLLTATNGLPRVDRYFHGRAVRIRGKIISQPVDGSPDRRLYLTSNALIVPVEAQTISQKLRDIPVGSLVEISGTCIMEAEPWRPNLVFTKIKGFFLVTRTADDIRVLARPSWWTTGRLSAVIGALFALLFAILFWNVSLRRLSNRKGRDLAKATLAKSESELKVQERTRLATELHDSIVQNLTGASFHLRTADKLRSSNPDAIREQMSIALRTLDSCRDEIRNCIWDLRNRALDEPSMDEALLRTLAPHIGETKLSIRFAVPRTRLTDNTAHGIICIIRELVLNAIRHGHATLIQIAGCLDHERLLFSVKDNGSGFDPQNTPGIEQGHFGLQGIRERVELLQGDVEISSHPHAGTRVSVSVSMPKEGKQ